MGQWNHVYTVTFLPLEGSFLYLVQIFYTKGSYAMHNNFCPWPIPSRSYAHDFAISDNEIVFAHYFPSAEGIILGTYVNQQEEVCCV